MFQYETQIRLHHTDAAGLLFFTEQLVLAHDAYESMMESIGYPFAPQLRTSPYLLPIVHAETDFLAALATGDKITIQVVVERIGDSSFTLGYTLLRNESERVGTARTVHVMIDKRSNQPVTLVPEFRKQLEQINR